MQGYSFAELVNINDLQSMADALYKASAIPTVIIDHNANRLVSTAASQLCEAFHASHPEAAAACLRNGGSPDRSAGQAESTPEGVIHRHCPNGLRHIDVPITIEGKHLASLMFCSFLYDDDTVDPGRLREQARRYGFDEEAYLAMYDATPRLSREQVRSILEFHRNFVGLISRQGLANLRLSQEIEAHKNAREQLDEQQRYNRTLSDALPTAIFFKNTDGVYQNCNEAFAELVGLPKERIIGYTDQDIAQPELAAVYRAHDDALYEDGGVQRYQAIVRDTDDNVREVQFSQAVYCAADGSLQGIIGSAADLSEYKDAKRKAHENEELYRLLADNAGDVIGIVGQDFRYQYISPSVERLLGYPPDEALALRLEDHFLPESFKRLKASMLQGFMDGLPDAKPHEEAVREEYVQIRKDGSTVWTEMVTTPLRDEAGEIHAWIGVSRDITDRKRSESQLIAAKEQAESASRTKSEFLANMSHEIRTPLNGIFGMLQLLAANTHVNDDQQQYINVALESGKSLLTIIEDILELSRFDTGTATFVVAPFSPGQAVETVIDNFRLEALRRGLSLFSKVDADVPATLLGDVGRVRQVLLHLVGNALKFTPQGHVRISVQRIKSSSKGLARLRFSVSDTGIGIAKDKLNDIFEPFAQVDGSYTRRYQGAGIGLSLVKRIVDRLGGEVGIESVPGGGTTVHLTLEFPARCEDVPPESPCTPEPNAAHRILVTEDDRLNQLTTQRFLEKLGYDAVVVSTGEEAIECLRVEEFDILIMDVQMPGMDGMQTTEAIRADDSLGPGQNIPIVAMTAHAMAGDRERFLSAGMNAYIAKPVDMKELRNVLLEVMQGETA